MAVFRRNQGFQSPLTAPGVTNTFLAFADAQRQDKERKREAAQDLETLLRTASDEEVASRASQLRSLDDKELKQRYGRGFTRARLETLITAREGAEATPAQTLKRETAEKSVISTDIAAEDLLQEEQETIQKTAETTALEEQRNVAANLRSFDIQEQFVDRETGKKIDFQTANRINAALRQSGEAFALEISDTNATPAGPLLKGINELAAIYMTQFEMPWDEAIKRATDVKVLPGDLAITAGLLANAIGDQQLNLYTANAAVAWVYGMARAGLQVDLTEAQIELTRKNIDRLEKELKATGSGLTGSVEAKLRSEYAAIPSRLAIHVIGPEKFKGIPLTASGELQRKKGGITGLFAGAGNIARGLYGADPKARPVKGAETVPVVPGQEHSFPMALYSAAGTPNDPAHIAFLAASNIPRPLNDLDMKNPAYAEAQMQALDEYVGYQIFSVTVTDDDGETRELFRPQLVQRLNNAHRDAFRIRLMLGQLNVPEEFRLTTTTPRGAPSAEPDAEPSEQQLLIDSLISIQDRFQVTDQEIGTSIEALQKQLAEEDPSAILDENTPVIDQGP